MLLKKLKWLESLHFIGAGAGQKRTGSATLGTGLIKHVLWIAEPFFLLCTVQRRERFNIYNLETQLPSSWYGTEKEQSNI